MKRLLILGAAFAAFASPAIAQTFAQAKSGIESFLTQNGFTKERDSGGVLVMAKTSDKADCATRIGEYAGSIGKQVTELPSGALVIAAPNPQGFPMIQICHKGKAFVIVGDNSENVAAEGVIRGN